MIHQSFSLLAKSITYATFSEMMNPGGHDQALAMIVQSLEIFMKAKLYNKNKDIIFLKKNDKKTVNIRMLPKMFEDELGIKIDSSAFIEAVDERNKIVHQGLVISNPGMVLQLAFNVFIPVLEKYYKDELDSLLNYYFYDDAIFEGYVLEQLDAHGIFYSDYIKEVFSV